MNKKPCTKKTPVHKETNIMEPKNKLAMNTK